MNEEIKIEPENFSPASARLCFDAIMKAMPKSKLGEYIGEFNELGVVLNKLVKLANIEDENKAL